MSDDDLAALRLLRRQGELPPELVDASLERARGRFHTALEARTTPTGASRPTRHAPPGRLLRRPRTAVLASAALVLAGGLVVTGVSVTHWSRPESAAADTLRDAARAAAADTAPTGAYTRVEETELAMAYASADGEQYDQGYLAPTTTTTWIPADVSGTWVRRTWSDPATTFYGGAAAREAAAQDYATEAHRDDPLEERAAGGDFTVGELGGEQPGTLGPADVAGLPRDPAALVRRIEAAPRPVGTSDAEHVFDTTTQLLRTGLVPADLRATMYEALATLPGIVVTEEQVALDGREGTAIGLPSGSGTERREIVVDRTDGTYLGERTLQTERNGSIPAGALIDSVAVRVTAVDDRP